MATLIKNDQSIYTGRGPLDGKGLVKTYSELLDAATWIKNVDGVETLVAYNYMIVGVWLNKDDPSKNGFYYLLDPTVTTALKKPDVTNPDNWRRLDNAPSVDEDAINALIDNKLDEATNALKDELDDEYVTKDELLVIDGGTASDIV